MHKFILILILSLGSIGAEPSLEEIQNIQITDIQKLTDWLKDKKTKPRFKVMILEKLNILLLSNRSEVAKNSESLFELLSISMKNKDAGSSYNYLLRKKTCLLLSYFNGFQKESDSYDLMKKQISLEENGEVAGTCIRTLSQFESKEEETNKFLLQMIQTSLKKKKIDDDDIEVVSASVDILEKLKKKQSYLTLMKILNSKFPNDIKNQAKKILETLPQ